MPEPDLGIGSPVKDFVKNFIKQAEEGMKELGYSTCSENNAHIKIDLAATEVKEAGGGLKLHVFSLGGKASDSNTQRMTIFAKKIDETEEAEKLARIEKAKADEAIAKTEQEMAKKIGNIKPQFIKVN